MTMSDPVRFTSETPLYEVLRDPAGSSVLHRLAPSIPASNLLHTFHGQPVGLVVATEEGLTEQDRRQIIAELEAIPVQDVAPAATAPAIGGPTRVYEGDEVAVGSARLTAPAAARVWERWELVIEGPRHGNPFVDVEVTARFFGPDDVALDVLGFYDGDGVYRVRFLPPAEGAWRVELTSNARSLDGLAARFDVAPAVSHGPVRVADRFHFAYADGTRYLPIGTTSYAWTHQGAELEERTLDALAASPFNKIRMCVFPKSYTYNSNEPERYPFARSVDGWDPTRFDPASWADLEHRIDQLAALGIEADIILFHPYDRWGFATMDAATDDRYLRYAIARLSAFRNVWFSLANEWDLLFEKTEADWERWAGIVQRWDAAGHLLSIHNCREIYDQSRPWITHASLQRIDPVKTSEMTTEWRAAWGKPVVIDECAYEGDIDQGWGNITGEEMTRRFWEGALRGGYVGHGETYVDPDEILWWAKGGELHGTSPDRIRFLAELTRATPGGVLEPLPLDWDATSAGVPGEYYLYYYGFNQPAFRRFFHDPALEWEVDVIDTWAMTIETLPGTYSGRFSVELPSRQYMAIRLRRHLPKEHSLV
jgi:hypothetical protein